MFNDKEKKNKKNKLTVSRDEILEESLKLMRLRKEREIRKMVKEEKKRSKEFWRQFEYSAMKALDEEIEEIKSRWTQNNNDEGAPSFHINQLNVTSNGHIAGYLESGDGLMGDTYNVSGQAGAVGSNAHAYDMTFNQIVSHLEKSIDLSELATQLTELRLMISAKQDLSPQTALALGKVAEAELAAIEKNASKVVDALRSVGKWTLGFANEIGKDIVVAAIKQSMGMP
jgi:hypothetical protein